MNPFPDSARVTVVLNRPRVSENIGSAARAMMNMGLDQLVVVAPDDFDRTRAEKTATHSAASILDRMEICSTLSQALAPFEYVVGTTARLGGQRLVESPRTVALRVATLCENNRVALLFGPEDRGLTNGEICFCHALINIPTLGFSSLNLAQAVVIVCYELLVAVEHQQGLPLEKKQVVPRLATVSELEIMYQRLSLVLAEIGYVNPENPDFWLNRVRQFLSRIKIQAGETGIVKGVIDRIVAYGESRYQRGQTEKK
ncbi:RNA methyltransferase [Desulforapulum autotrophicum]|nr:RNA methyltransferase [Desulforapulum autotrophicum]